MPQALVVIGQFVAAFGGAAAATAVAVAGFFGGWVPAVLAFAASSALLEKAQKKGRSQPGPGLEVAVTDSGAQGYAIYGFVKCSGINKIPAITGGNSEGSSLEQILELAMHEVYAFNDVYADDHLIANHEIADDGIGTISQGEKYDDMLWVRRYFGTTTQTVDATLFFRYPGLFTVDFRGRGRAYAALSYFWGDGKTFNGVPNMTFEVAGRMCYDPRLEGSPGANPDDSNFIRWTHNPALQWADYLRWSRGGRVGSSGIDWNSVLAAANVNDGIVPIPGSFSAFATDGNASISSKVITKTGGTNGVYDASVRSTASIASGSISAAWTAGDVAFGLNTDPTTNANYTSIDYCWLFNTSNQAVIYESGVAQLTENIPSALMAKTVLRIDYDGTYMRYFIDDRCVRTVKVATAGTTYFFDSSLSTTGGSFTIDVQHRYTCNMRLQLVQNWHDNAKLFIEAMLGRMTYRDGKWYCYAGSWEAASYVVEKTDWLQIDRIRTVAPRDEGQRYNTVRCWYVDPKRNWQREECFPRRNSAYKSADANEEITLEIDQTRAGCTNEFEAQRKAEFLLRQSRNQISLAGALPPRFRKVATGEVGAFNFAELGWTAKLHRFRVMDLNSNGSASVAIAEEQEADWTDLAASEYNAPSTSTIPITSEPTTPTAPQNFTIRNTIAGTLDFKFDEPLVIPVGTRYQIIRSTNSADASVGTIVWQGDTLYADLSMPSSRHWYFARAFANSYYSPYSPNTFGVFGAGRYSTPDILNMVPDPDVERSSSIGSHWHSLVTEVFSLSATGGINGGLINIAVFSADYSSATAKAIYSVPVNSPVWSHGLQFAIAARIRRTAAVSWSTGNTYTLSVFPVAWNGVNTPNLQEMGGGGNCRIFPNSTAFMHIFNINSLPLNEWQDFQRNVVLESFTGAGSAGLFAQPNSYPYVMLALAVPSAPDGRNGNIQVDMAGCFL